jgi:hypothetical protein
MTKVLDPLDINGRLYRQIGELLDQMEGDPTISLGDRIKALIAVGRIQTIFVGLRKENRSDPDAGSAVRKYAGAFKNAAGGRKARGRPSAAAAAADDELDLDDDGDDAA